VRLSRSRDHISRDPLIAVVSHEEPLTKVLGNYR
jgi:hypothetical protein